MRGFFALPLVFLQAKAIRNNFCRFSELVGFDLWILDSGFRFLVSGFRVSNSGSGFPFLGFRLPIYRWVKVFNVASLSRNYRKGACL